MLVRRPYDGSEWAIHQEQHALVSGLLAAAWRPALHPRLVAAITLHDSPWRTIDRVERRSDDGKLVDFVAFPIEERLTFYERGIDELEPVDAYLAYLVSLHYSSFSGTKKLEPFASNERARRERLQGLVGSRMATIETDLRWLQFFDILSLSVCLTGPDVPPEHLPVWLRGPSAQTTAPDGRVLTLRWEGAARLHLSPLPLEGPMTVDVEMHGPDGPRLLAIEVTD